MDLEREYLLQNYARYPLVLARGKGCYLYGSDGKRYLDFITGIGVNAHDRGVEFGPRLRRPARREGRVERKLMLGNLDGCDFH